MQVKLFGGCLVQLDGKSVTEAFRTQKERALLAYLCVEANHPHPREHLAELFWPGRPEGSARANLRQALLGIRRVLEPGPTPSPAPVIICPEDTIQLNPDLPFELDTRDFLAALARVRDDGWSGVLTCIRFIRRDRIRTTPTVALFFGNTTRVRRLL